MTAIRVLLVDDDASVTDSLRRALRTLCPDWTVASTNSAEEAIKLVDRGGGDVVVADILMRGMAGTDLLRVFKERHPRVLRVVLSGMLDRDALVESAKWAEVSLCKPCRADLLRDAVEHAWSTRPL